MAHATVKAIALKLGNAIAMPVLPYTPNNASADAARHHRPDATSPRRRARAVAEQSIITGFKNVVLMGDHGGGQPRRLGEVAKKLDAKYAPQGIHVYFCDEVYAKAQGDFDKWLAAQRLPGELARRHPRHVERCGTWAAKAWTRSALIPERARRHGRSTDSNAPRVNNGISGDARRSSKALGKQAFDQKVDYAVRPDPDVHSARQVVHVIRARSANSDRARMSMGAVGAIAVWATCEPS